MNEIPALVVVDPETGHGTAMDPSMLSPPQCLSVKMAESARDLTAQVKREEMTASEESLTTQIE